MGYPESVCTNFVCDTMGKGVRSSSAPQHEKRPPGNTDPISPQGFGRQHFFIIYERPPTSPLPQDTISLASEHHDVTTANQNPPCVSGHSTEVNFLSTSSGSPPQEEKTLLKGKKKMLVWWARLGQASEDHRWLHLLLLWGRNTTIHGVKFVVDDCRIPFRKFSWLVAVLLCVGLLLHQVIDRVEYYSKHLITVNVEINKNFSLAFPTVTICNQNVFQLTKATELGLYEILSRSYGSQSGTHDRHENLKLESEGSLNTSMASIYDLTAQEIDDLLISCTWYKKECHAANFTRLNTDHGVCYSFNYVGPHLSVQDTGSGNGLTLVLNIQQYEYMAGPFGSAGVRFHMHAREDFPMVTDLGQAAASGTHTFVGLKIVKSTSLKPPDGGKCGDKMEDQPAHIPPTEPYTEKKCVLVCRARFYLSACQCVEFYMRTVFPHARVCNLREQLGCVNNASRDFMRERRNRCKCAIACQDIIYEPNLSFSLASHLGLGLLTGNTRTTAEASDRQEIEEAQMRSRLQRDYNYGRDIAALVDQPTFATDESMLRSLLDMFQRHQITVVEGLETWLQRLDDFVPKERAFHLDAHKRKTRYLSQQEQVVEYNFFRGFESADERTFSLVAHQFFEFTYQFKESLDKVVVTSAADKQVLQELVMFQVEVSVHTRRRCAIVSHAKVLELQNLYLTGMPYSKKPVVANGSSITAELVHILAPKKLLKESVLSEEGKFQENIGLQLNSTYTEMLDLLHMAQERRAYPEEQYLRINQRFQDQSKAWLDYRAAFLRPVFYGPLFKLRVKQAAFRKEKETLLSLYTTLEKDVGALRAELSALRSQTQFLELLLPAMHRYASHPSLHNISRDTPLKSHLARRFTSHAALLTTFMQILQKLGDYLRYCSMNWPRLWNMLLNTSLKMWRDILDDEDALDQYRHYGEKDWLRGNLLVTENNLTNVYTRMQTEISLFLKACDQDLLLIEEIRTVMDHFRAYELHGEINAEFLRENFVKLDIFFRELNIEDIRQVKAYEFTALVSDIGGTLGLFIGASLLSIFELLDLALQLVLQLHKYFRRQRTHSPSSCEVTEHTLNFTSPCSPEKVNYCSKPNGSVNKNNCQLSV